jgi:hypothetical protein
MVLVFWVMPCCNLPMVGHRKKSNGKLLVDQPNQPET